MRDRPWHLRVRRDPHEGRSWAATLNDISAAAGRRGLAASNRHTQDDSMLRLVSLPPCTISMLSQTMAQAGPSLLEHPPYAYVVFKTCRNRQRVQPGQPTVDQRQHAAGIGWAEQLLVTAAHVHRGRDSRDLNGPAMPQTQLVDAARRSRRPSPAAPWPAAVPPAQLPQPTHVPHNLSIDNELQLVERQYGLRPCLDFKGPSSRQQEDLVPRWTPLDQQSNQRTAGGKKVRPARAAAGQRPTAAGYHSQSRRYVAGGQARSQLGPGLHGRPGTECQWPGARRP